MTQTERGERNPNSSVAPAPTPCLQQTELAASTLCWHASLSVPFLLLCQNISCCLFIYFPLIMEGIMFPEECQQMIRAPALILPAKPMPAFSAGKNSFFPEGSHECEVESKFDFFALFFLYLLSQSSPPGGAMEELIQLQLRALIQFTVSLRDNYSR